MHFLNLIERRLIDALKDLSDNFNICINLGLSLLIILYFENGLQFPAYLHIKYFCIEHQTF